MLELVDYFFTEVSAKVENSHLGRSEKTTWSVLFNCKISSHSKDRDMYRLMLSIGFDTDENRSYQSIKTSFEITGIFRVGEELSRDARLSLVKYNGTAALMGIVRGQMAASTGQLAHGPIKIPLINVKELVDQADKRNSAQAGQSAKKRASTRKKASTKRTKKLPKRKASKKTLDKRVIKKKATRKK